MPEIVFQEIAAKVSIGFFSWIKIFENTAFGHVTDVPIYVYMEILHKNSQRLRAVNYFRKKSSISDAWLGSKCASALLT